MGCSASKENIESEMLLLRLMRTEIHDERAQILKQLEELTGKRVLRDRVPDYIEQPTKKPRKSKTQPKKPKPAQIQKEKSATQKKKVLRRKQSTGPDDSENSVEDDNSNNSSFEQPK